MTNDQIKTALKQLFDCKTDFTVQQTGKKSGRVNGYYKPATHGIFLNDHNFATANEMMYTAIHELTHHILITEKGVNSPKSHSGIFWASFYDLLDKAVERGIYERTRSEQTQKLIAEAKRIEREIIEANKRLGHIIAQIYQSCRTNNERTEDVIEHDLQMTQARARSLVNESLLENNTPEDIAKSITKASNAEQRTAAQHTAETGKTPAQVKAIAQRKPRISDDDIKAQENLQKEKQRLERTIERLNDRLKHIEEQLQSI